MQNNPTTYATVIDKYLTLKALNDAILALNAQKLSPYISLDECRQYYGLIRKPIKLNQIINA